MWYLYIIRCGDDTLYTGITTDVARRFGEHECGGPRAARRCCRRRSRCPWPGACT
ncbi:MAG: GIY-YIG nuclease family protein [Candidatus Latescibacterota bacterium]|nr:GIY-YIG nuclease family protein [Candidatus Latescibacterota bacterium]